MFSLYAQPLVVLFLIVAASLQFVVLRQHPLPSIITGRKLGLVGLIVATLYLLNQIIAGNPTPFPALLSIALMALGQIIFGLTRLEDTCEHPAERTDSRHRAGAADSWHSSN